MTKVIPIPANREPIYLSDILVPGFTLSHGILADYDHLDNLISEFKKYKGNKTEKKSLKVKLNELILDYNAIRGSKIFAPIH